MTIRNRGTQLITLSNKQIKHTFVTLAIVISVIYSLYQPSEQFSIMLLYQTAHAIPIINRVVNEFPNNITPGNFYRDEMPYRITTRPFYLESYNTRDS